MVFGKLIDIVWFRLLVVYNCLKTSCLDECRSYTERKNEVRRSSGYKMDLTVDTALSDDILEENWYRFVSDNGDEMCTYPPGALSCGTYHPIWLNGKLF
jgi:hypothetical protein